MTRTDAVEIDLRQRLQELIRRNGAITRDLRAGHDDDSSEQATERENDGVLERLDAATRAEVAEINDALRRIERGHYGVCVVCQQPISAERLRALPTATVCAACQTSSRQAKGQ